MKITWLDANSWLIEAAGRRILIDPWLVGDLVFGNAPWLICGSRPQPLELPTDIDLILLSQGLADHAHPPTLQALDKAIPVVASPAGASVARELGYTAVNALAHGETLRLDSLGLSVQAFVGAPVGPAKRENAYVLSVLATGNRLYYEPHGYPDAAHLQELGSVDLAITPMADIKLMGLAPVICGSETALQIAQWLRPQVMLPTAEAGSVTYSGLLAKALGISGGAESVRSQVEAKGLTTQILQPVSGEPIELDLPSAVATGH